MLEDPTMTRILATLSVFVCVGSVAQACGPFLGVAQVPTLRQEYASADLVFVGRVVQSHWTNEQAGEGKSTIDIFKVVKNHPGLKGKKQIEHRSYVVINNPAMPPQYLIFGSVYKNRIDLHKGVLIESAALLDYFQSAIALDPKDHKKAYRFFFEHLENKDQAIAADALQEFAVADYRDVRPMAASLPAEQLAQWLQKPTLPAARVRLYAALLGDCGNDKHAAMLRKRISAGTDEGLDGLLVGYFLLQPGEGFDLIHRIMQDNKESFARKYAALLAVRFLGSFRQDVLARKQWLELTATLLNDPEMADFPISDFRQGKCWEMTDAIIDLYGKKGYGHPIIKREIVRFALVSPLPRARALVDQVRQSDPDWLRETEETLRTCDPADGQDATPPDQQASLPAVEKEPPHAAGLK
jgi:hypothetical protein